MSVKAIEVVSDLSGLRALREEWNALAGGFGSLLLRHEWNLALAEAFSEELLPAVHVLRCRGQIAAIAPLTLTRRAGVRCLEMFRGPTGSPPGPWGFLYRDEESLNELLRRVLAGGRPILLSQLESDSLETRLLRKLLPRRSVSVTRDAGASLRAPLGPSAHKFEARLSAGKCSMLRRRQRHAERLGEVRFEAISADEGNVDRYLQEFFRVEAAGWKSRSGTAILSMPGEKRFLTLYGQAAARLGLLRFYFLRINGEPAAAQLVSDYGGRLWQMKIGYDERFRRVSPGVLLAYEVLRHASEQGYEAYEFLGSPDSGKTIWADQLRHYCSVRIYPVLSSLLGGVALGHDLAIFARRRVARVIRRICPRDTDHRPAPTEGELKTPAAT